MTEGTMAMRQLFDLCDPMGRSNLMHGLAWVFHPPVRWWPQKALRYINWEVRLAIRDTRGHDKRLADERWARRHEAQMVMKHRGCPVCKGRLTTAPCCSDDDQWLFCCDTCKTTWTCDELYEMID